MNAETLRDDSLSTELPIQLKESIMYAKDKTTIKDRREMLRVKAKSLAEEARIIRREELRNWGPLREELHRHRIFEVRQAARATHLAYGFIRGRTLEQMEPTRIVAPGYTGELVEKHLWDEVRKMTRKYGPKDFVEPQCMGEPLKKAA